MKLIKSWWFRDLLWPLFLICLSIFLTRLYDTKTLTQTHNGSGDNVGRDKIVEQPIFNSQAIYKSPSSTLNVNINNKRVFVPYSCLSSTLRDDKFVLALKFRQTSDGIWDPSNRPKFQFKFTGPYESERVISGFPTSGWGPLKTLGYEQGILSYEFKDTPNPAEDVVFEIVSLSPIKVKEVDVYPLLDESPKISVGVCE